MRTRRDSTDFVRRRLLKQAGLLACGTLAGITECIAAGSESPAFRSVQDVQQWVPDGSWEVREGPVAIAANTSLTDARWAAAEAAKAQAQTLKLVARFAPQSTGTGLPSDSFQIAIDSRPRQGRGAAAKTINVVGVQTQVQLDVSPGQPALKDQLARLREAAAFAVLHAKEIDAVLPPSVVMGLASHVGQQAAADGAAAPPAPALVELLAGEQWRWKRAAPGQLREPSELAAAAQRASFLIAGNDGQYAPETLTALTAAFGERALRTEGAGLGGGRGTRQSLAQLESRLVAIAAPHHGEFKTWLKDPLMGQPEFTPDEKLPAEVVSEQRDMLVVLKLQRRIAAGQSPTGQVKVAAFDRAQGQSIRAAAEVQAPIAIAGLAARLRDRLQPPLATIDVDGSLLLSTDRQRLDQLLGPGDQRYSVERSGEGWVLATRLANGRVLQGSLAENPDRPNRPLARFAIVEPPQSEEKTRSATPPRRSGQPKVTAR